MAAASQTSLFKNVLVGVDGEPGGRDALALARLLIAPGGRLTLAHVHANEELPSRASNLSYDATQREASTELLHREREVAEVVADTAIVGAPSIARGLHHLAGEHHAERLDALDGVEGKIAYGSAAKELADFGHEVDLLIVGSHDRGPWGRIVFGSTSETLARIAQCPLIVVPHSAVAHQLTTDNKASIGATA